MATERDPQIMLLMRIIIEKATHVAQDAGNFQAVQHPSNLERIRADATAVLHAVALAEALYSLK